MNKSFIYDDSEDEDSKSQSLVRANKSIKVAPQQSDYIDQGIIQKQFYNSFNYSMLPDKYKDIKLTIGVSSPNKGEGKTLIASNLAVSFALAYKKKTVLVDLNTKNPSLHKIFGTNRTPGLVESFKNGSIFLSQTKLDHLYVLPAGKEQNFSIGLNDITNMRHILHSLRNEFDVVILDMNSVLPIDDFPAVFTNEVDGMLMVIDSKSTKYKDVEKMFRHINRNQMMGFVFNKVDEDTY